jgi:catechol 2,3-dioxygenase-like lactoylglutathione lyase family enzyme
VAADWDWDRVVFDHVKLPVRDAAASVAFYRQVLEQLEIPPLWENERGAQFANLVVVGVPEPGGPIHLAFVARSRAEVDAFHRAGLEAGGRDNGAQASGSSTAPTTRASTTQRSCSIPTGTTSKRSSASSSGGYATSRPRASTSCGSSGSSSATAPLASGRRGGPDGTSASSSSGGA